MLSPRIARTVLGAAALTMAFVTAEAGGRERALNPQPEPPGRAATATGDPWRRISTTRYGADDLGLARGASAARLARAAIARAAPSLGLRSTAGIRLGDTSAAAVSAGSRPLHTLRFHQTAGGQRLAWSEIDVAVVDGAVTSISAATVPIADARLHGARRISATQARVIAERAQPGTEQVLAAQPYAYAGTPATPFKRARPAWIVQVEPADQQPGRDSAESICVVIDATNGKVIMRYKGFVQQPTPLARSATATPVAAIFDGLGKTGIGDHYASLFGDHTVAVSPVYYVAERTYMAPLITTYGAVLYAACKRRSFCGPDGVPDGQSIDHTAVLVGNSGHPLGSSYSHSNRTISLEPRHADNYDVIAHEFGHQMDLTLAGYGSGRVHGNPQVDEVEEALADMFAYDYERTDGRLGEDTSLGFPGDDLSDGFRDLADPGRLTNKKVAATPTPYPSDMCKYRTGATDVHFNATILGHAYYLFVQKVGHSVAGNVLRNVPMALPQAPSFIDVRNWFVQRAGELYPGTSVRAAAETAFALVHLGAPCPATHHGPSPQGCALKVPTPRECGGLNTPPIVPPLPNS